MRRQFEEQLAHLHEEMIAMGARCEEAIAAAVRALQGGGDALLDQVREIDAHIDRQERDIETLCLHVLLSQQPVAHDLRRVSAAMKMVSDMERIGDQAADIAEIVPFVTTAGQELAAHGPIAAMARAVIGMVTDAVRSFVDRDVGLARAVIDADDEVDSLFLTVKQELVDLIGRQPERGAFCLDVLMIAKYLERIGDHATNIAEWVEYAMTGVYKGGRL